LLEMNPVVLDDIGQPRPVDAVGRRGAVSKRRLPPPADFLSALRYPKSVALAGVSEKPGGVGRVILENLLRCPALAGAITLIKPGQTELLGLPCVPDVSALRAAPVDLLVLALPAPAAAAVLLALIAQGGGATVVGLVSGGLGDGADAEGLGRKLEEQLQAARTAGRWTPTVLGPNFLGHWVPELQLDTSFIPLEKLAAPPPAGSGLVLLSQSGAFLLCRRSRAPRLRFGLGVALGNQMDAALPDFLRALAKDPACRAVAAYVEGFGPGQLLATAKAANRLVESGVPVLMHRAGRTPAGQAAAASHTGAMAGDWELEQALLQRAGVKLSPSIAAFDAALEWLGTYPAIPPGPIALVTNAGFESVNASDLLASGMGAAVLSPAKKEELAALLARHQLSGLVNPQLPLDLTPMAGEEAFLAAVDLVLGSAALLIVGLVPFTRRLNTARAGAAPFAAELAKLAAKHGKPVAVAVDAGADYDDYRAALGEAGLVVFDRVETALLGLRTLR
jgi:acyl-CoA synthetase (NDP forming)